MKRLLIICSAITLVVIGKIYFKKSPEQLWMEFDTRPPAPWVKLLKGEQVNDDFFGTDWICYFEISSTQNYWDLQMKTSKDYQGLKLESWTPKWFVEGIASGSFTIRKYEDSETTSFCYIPQNPQNPGYLFIQPGENC